jgi:NADH:flavin oxidoreductase/NADH oxidase
MLIDTLIQVLGNRFIHCLIDYIFQISKTNFIIRCFFSKKQARNIASNKTQKVNTENKMNPKYAPLFTPYTFNNGVEIKNRLTVVPLTIYDSGEDGEITDASPSNASNSS